VGTKNYIVRFAESASDTEVDRLITLKNGNKNRRFKKAFNGAVVALTPRNARDLCLTNDANLLWVEEDQNITVDPQMVATVRKATAVNAPSWGLDRINQRTGLDGQYSFATDGAGVDVYVVDSGLNASHNEFAGRVKQGFSALNGTSDTTDGNGHGTHVAGIVAGATYGVAPRANIVPVQALDAAGSGTVSSVIAGIDWAIEHHTTTPAVLNLSLGSPKSDSLNAAVDRAFLDGITVVVAAGNSNVDACQSSPANNKPSVLTVGATTRTDARASYSNFGECLDLFAPGSEIVSTWHTSPNATQTLSGTSMAAPHVAGLAARYLSSATSAVPSQVMDALRADATPNVVASAGTLSPNLLAFGDPQLIPIPPAPVTPANPVVPANPGVISAPPGTGTVNSPSLPSQPSRPKALSGATSSLVSWNNSSDGGLPIIGHVINVFRKQRLIGRVVVDADQLHTIAGLQAKSAHTFSVAAMNALGVGPYSQPSNAVIPLRTTRTFSAPQKSTAIDVAPSRPTRVKVRQRRSSVDVRWNVPKNAAVSGYEVLFIQRKKVVAKVVTDSVSGVRIAGLKKGRYDVRVLAVNPAGSSARSKPVRLNFR
jgi:subtilisin family serine protease